MGNSPTPGLTGVLQSLYEDAGVALSASITSHSQDLGRLFALEADLSGIEACLGAAPERVQYAEARRQLATSAFSASIGLYNLAYSGLRVFLELSFAGAFFSAHELKRRQWLADRTDFSWRVATDGNDGVLSRNFIQEFNEPAMNEGHESLDAARRVYRACSQHLHGKSIATESLPKSVVHDAAAAATWLELAESAAQSVVFLMYARYGGDLLPQSANFLQIVENRFAHLPSAQQYLGMV